MTDQEKRDLHSECWKVVNRVNALIAGCEQDQRNSKKTDPQDVIDACINITNQVISLGSKFGVSV